MSILIRGMEMPKSRGEYALRVYVHSDGTATIEGAYCRFEGEPFVAVPVPPHERLRKRIVYRGEVYNAIEAARVNALDGILSDRYKDGFHDGLKRALEILANVEDAPTIIPASEEGK